MAQLEFSKDAPEKFSIRDWQQHDLDSLAELEQSANWSRMGTYKTSTGLWLIERKLEEKPGNALIVTTKSGKGAYFDSIPRCLDFAEWDIFNIGTQKVEEVILHDLRVECDLDDFVRRLKAGDKKCIVLAHYHCFVNDSPMKDILIDGTVLNQLKWSFILLDEAHRIKSKDVQWTRNLKRIGRLVPYRHVMTGTGFVNNPSEIWSLLNFLRPEVYTSYWRFRRRFCLEENWSGYTKVVGIEPTQVEVFRRMRRALGPNRTMQEVHADIAEPIVTHHEVELNATQRRMYTEIVNSLRTLDQQGYPIHSPNVISQLQRLRQISVATPELVEVYFDHKLERRIQVIKLVEPSSKLDLVMDLIEDLEWDDENRQQMIIFSNFRDPLELLKARFAEQRDKRGRLRRAAIPYIHMEQKDSEQTRYEKWHEIFPQKKHQIFLSTIDLGGESINLTSAEYCVFLDRNWSPAKNEQAIGRIYRPGQKHVAQIHYINAMGTVDKRVKELTDLKTNWFRQLFDDSSV